MVGWSDADLGAAIRALRTSHTVAEAFEKLPPHIRLAQVGNWPRVFAKAGLGHPKSFLISPRESQERDTDPAPPPPDSVRGKSTGIERVLVCPDLHCPYHDELAWSTFLAVARGWRPDILVILGDF